MPLNQEPGKDGALCSLLHLPGVDVHHYELGEWAVRNELQPKCHRLFLV